MCEKGIGTSVLKASMVKLFTSFVKFFNVGKTMDGIQIAETIDLIIDNYPFLSMIDFKLFFSRMQTGFYGTFYDRMDGMLIMEKLNAYVSEKQDCIEARNINLHKQMKAESNLISGYHPEVIKAMEEAMGKKKIEQAFKESVPREKTAAEKIADRWMRQFDNLYSKFGVPHLSGRFIKINNQVFDFTSFMNRKFENATK